MKLHETCLCAKHTLEFSSEFKGDVVTKIYCPTCLSRSPDDTLVFELCEPGEYRGMWGVHYNKGELKRLDPHFRDTDAYYISLLASGVCGPLIVADHRKGGLCRIFGYENGPDDERMASALSAKDAAVAQEKPARRKRGTKAKT